MPEQSLLEQMIAAAGGPEAFATVVAQLPPEHQAQLAADWRLRARPEQLPPPGDWLTWLVLAGRGFGKTRTGAEFVRQEVEAGRAQRIALIAPTAAAARDVLVEGPSGLLAVSPPSCRPVHEPSKRKLSWPGGATALLFSGEEPDRLRGPQFDLAWVDELAAFFDPAEVWTQLSMVLRLGPRPRAIVTTTPRAIGIIRQLVTDPTVAVTRGRTVDNARNLPPSFLGAVTAKYAGTRIGRQELDAEILEDAPGAMWRLADIDAARLKNAPDLLRTVIGLDPAVSTSAHSNETGIIVAGIAQCPCRGEPELHAFVLADYTAALTPAAWAKAVQTAYVRHRADRIIAERNQGGALVEANLRANGGGELPLTTIHAHKGKASRAEPVAALYEQGRVHHVGALPALEDQLTGWSPLEAATSPDRLDALVYALTELLVEPGVPEAPEYNAEDFPPVLRRDAVGYADGGVPSDEYGNGSDFWRRR